MIRNDHREAPWRHRSRSGSRGQSTTELALIAPLLAIILFGIIEISGAYGAKMDLQQATAQAARTGALEGNGGIAATACSSIKSLNAGSGYVTTDPVDRDMVDAVLNTHGVDRNNISQIQVYDATADGSVYGNAINTYVPPFVTSALSGTQTITGPYSTSPQQWLSCQRHPDEPSDSVGVRVAYAYHPVTPLFGRATISMVDSTTQRLNPSQGAVPCPVPGVPINVSITTNPAPPTPFALTPTAGSNDAVTWSAVPLASTYSIYHSIGNVNGGQFDPAPIWTGTGTVIGNQVQATINITSQSPTNYEVTGTNFCGEGQRSVPLGDGRPNAAATATIAAQQTATAAAGQTATAVAMAATATSVAATAAAQATAQSGTATAVAQVTATAQASATAGAATATAAAANATATAAASGTTVDDKTTTGANPFAYKGATGGTGGWAHCSSTSTPSCASLGYPATLSGGTLSFDRTSNDYVTLPFTGTGISLYGEIQSNGGIGAVSIDSNPATNVDFYSPSAVGNQLLWNSGPLTAGAHTLKVQVTNNKNASSSDYYVGIDRVVIHP